MSAKGKPKGNGHDDASEVPGPKVKAEESKALAQLVALIQERIAENPYERDGKLWCQDAYSLAPVLGVHPVTLRRWFKANPTTFRVQAVMTADGRTTLVRLVEEGEPEYSPTQEAKYLAKIWESQVGRKHTPKEFGLLYHFAKACPALPGVAGLVFKFVLKEWGAFMGIVKTLEEFKYPDTPRYYQYPRLSIIHAFAQIAVEFWVQGLQEAGLAAHGPEVGMTKIDAKAIGQSALDHAALLVGCNILKLEDLGPLVGCATINKQELMDHLETYNTQALLDDLMRRARLKILELKNL